MVRYISRTGRGPGDWPSPHSSLRHSGGATRRGEGLIRGTLVALIIVLGLVCASTAHAQPRRVPRPCRTVPAVRLCAIHAHVHGANQYRRLLAKHAIRYQWIAERHPARRGRILDYWLVVHRRVRGRWLSWRSDALCVHHYEGAWNANTGNGYSGGMQFADSTWLSSGGGKYAAHAYLATPSEQLSVAYRLWRAAGWNPWPNTARSCGLL